MEMAHRIAYMLEYTNPEDLHILHKCDNPQCVNLNHLNAGTHSENIQEAWDRGSYGDKVISDEEVGELIKLEKNSNMTHQEIADKFNIHRSYVGKIVNGHIRTQSRN